MTIAPVSKIGIAFVAACVVMAVIYSCRDYSLQRVVAPSDDALVRTFKAHRGELERLRQMSTEDVHETSFFSESNISNGLPASRRNEYKSLLKLSLGLQVGANYDGSVKFIFTGAGQAISPSWAKGIQFIPIGAKVVGTRIATLDGCPKLPVGVYLREIEPRWFLFCQRDE